MLPCYSWSPSRTRRSVLGLTLFSSILSVDAFMAARPPQPSASVTISQVQVAFIGSGAFGGCTLYYRGRSYPFKVGGLGIGGIGISRLDATGSVFNLRRLEDFNGVYGQARTGWAIGQHGKGEMWLQNANGVYLRLEARRQGLSLTLGADGMLVQLGG
jgi:hypothetical protein